MNISLSNLNTSTVNLQLGDIVYCLSIRLYLNTSTVNLQLEYYRNILILHLDLNTSTVNLQLQVLLDYREHHQFKYIYC